MASEAPVKQSESRSEERVEQPKLWHVVLLDDNEHSYEYVMLMVQALFGHPFERAYEIAKKVDNDGRAICMTTHKELAELKQEQIHAFGKDPLIDSCQGSMSSIIEPADYGDEDLPGGGGAGPEHP
jgi:ATP-dependent Clp protease adaptor protein ClpS